MKIANILKLAAGLVLTAGVVVVGTKLFGSNKPDYTLVPDAVDSPIVTIHDGKTEFDCQIHSFKDVSTGEWTGAFEVRQKMIDSDGDFGFEMFKTMTQRAIDKCPERFKKASDLF